jgi:hypothetical protein
VTENKAAAAILQTPAATIAISLPGMYVIASHRINVTNEASRQIGRSQLK